MYHYSKILIISGLAGLVVAMPLTASAGTSAHAASEGHPAHVEHIGGSEFGTVTLTEKAIERIGLETTTVREGEHNGTSGTYVPYSSIIYTPHGKTYVYTSAKARTFIRHEIVVDRIEGDHVFMRSGPSTGTTVASVGVAELYGTEFEVGH